MASVAGASFEPETIKLLRLVLENAAAMLPTHLRTSSIKIELAELILKAAARGERDPVRLCSTALITVTARYKQFSTNEGHLRGHAS